MKKRILKGRYVPDNKVEIAPYIVDIPRGEGMTQLMVLEPEHEPIEPIKHFDISRPKPKPQKKDKSWVMATVVGAITSCVVAVFGLMIAPVLSTAIILGDLVWLGIVAFANWR